MKCLNCNNDAAPGSNYCIEHQVITKKTLRYEDEFRNQKKHADFESKRRGKENIGRKEGCFVATAVFGNYEAPEVVYLRAFRDETLSRNFLGRDFILIYYKISPPLAKIIASSEWVRKIVRRFFLQPIISFLQYFEP